METALKQRLLGAAVLIALAVTFLPLLVMQPAPDSGAQGVPLNVPAAPDDGAGRTVDLPLVPVATGQPVLGPAPVPPPPAADGETVTPEPPSSPATAAGNYAVNFGSYRTSEDAGRVIAALRAGHLAAYQEPLTLGGRTVYRVRIGPFPTAADAESARLAAGRVRDDIVAKVVVLDAGTVATPTPTPPAPAKAAPAVPSPPAPATTTVSTAVRPPATAPAPVATSTPPPAAPVPASPAPAASSVGFAIQLGAFANPDEATRVRDRARAAGFSAFVEQVHTDHGNLSRVRVGPVADRADADRLRAQVASKLGINGIVRPHP